MSFTHSISYKLMGLYDNYRLSNSTSIPQYQGSAGDAFVKVGEYKQGLYDTNLSASNTINGQADEVSSNLPQDQSAVEELRNTTQGRIKELVKRGDWENSGPEIQQLGQNFANRQREILAPQQQYQEYRKGLDEKDLNLTPEQKQGLLGMSLAGYQGLKKNGRGQYVGSFSGAAPAKNIDVNKKVDEWVKDAVAQKWGSETETLSSGDGGMWIVKNGEKVEKLEPDRIAAIVNNAAANDTDYQSYKNMESKLAGFRGLSVTSSDDVPDGPLKSNAIYLHDMKGIPFNQAYSVIAGEAAHSMIDSHALQYAIQKYTKNDKFTEQGLKDNPYELQKQKHAMEQTTIPPFISQGPDSKLTDDEKNYKKLSSNVVDSKGQLTDIQGSISHIDQQLQNKTLAPSTRTQLEAEKNTLQSQLNGVQSKVNRSEEIMGYSKDRTAQSMGYNDYDDFLKRNTPGLKRAIGTVFPTGISTVQGKKLSVDELSEAAADNRIQANIVAPSGPGGTAQLTGSTITLKDGTKVSLSNQQKGNQLWDQVAKVLQSGSSKINQFNKKLEDTHESNVKDFSVQSSNISLNDNDRKELAAHIKSNMDGVRFSKPGQLESVKAPDDIRVYTVGTNGLGTDVKVRAEGLDKDGKGTGDYYDVTMPNSNIGDIISSKLGESSDPSSRMAADMLQANSGARQLFNTIPGNKIHVGQIQVPGSKSDDADGIDVSVKVTRSRDGSISYNLIQEDNGKILKSTGSAGVAGSWIDNLQSKGTYSNGQKQSDLNAKSRRSR